VLDKVSKSSCYRPVILDLFHFFVPRSIIELLVNERLHGIDIAQVLGNFMVRVRQDFWGQWFIWIFKITNIKDSLPHCLLLLEQIEGLLAAFISSPFLLHELLSLCLNNSISDLIQSWKVLEICVEHVKH